MKSVGTTGDRRNGNNTKGDDKIFSEDLLGKKCH